MDLIHWAARGGDLAEVRRLVQENPPRIHSPDDDGYLPLILAAAAGHVDVVAYLLDQVRQASEPLSLTPTPPRSTTLTLTLHIHAPSDPLPLFPRPDTFLNPILSVP